MKATALVTGGGAGIGAAIAARLDRSGYRTIIVDRDEAAAEAVAAACGDAVAKVLDVGDEAAVATLFAGIDRLDCLVNNVGIDIEGPPELLARADWQRLVSINLSSALFFSQHAYALMHGSGGAIVNISSIQGLATEPGVAAYAAVKAGLLGLTRGLAIDWARAGIRVNAVLPGAIRTPMMDAWAAEREDAEGALERLAQAVPLGRLGSPEDVAGMVAFLLSSDAAYVTGASFVVDGGALARHPL